MKVFISYAREDSGTAKKLYHDLKKAGAIPWMDMEDLLPGQKWEQEIDNAIKESSYFLILLSTNSVTKTGVVQKEIRKALDNFQLFSPDKLYIIPVRLDKCKPPHHELHALHWADLFPSYEDGLKKILRVLVPDSVETSQPQNVPEKPVPSVPVKEPKYKLRSKPITTDNSGDFKSGRDVKNEFKYNGDGTISDHATGLIWQKSGSPDEKYLKDVPAYIERLNSEKFAGYSDWRLPTVDELKSLLTPQKMNGDLYIDPIFDKTQRWCWTSDKRSSGGACYVDFNRGGVDWLYLVDYRYVRAVRSRQ